MCALSEGPLRPPRYTLLQIRNADDPARSDELRAFVARLGVPVDCVRTVDVLSETLGPHSVAGADAVLVGGAGEYSVLDTLPVIQRFNDYVAELSQTGVPMFASCFGFQAMVVGLGGSVIRDEPNAEVGTYSLQCTPESTGDPVFGALPQRFNAQLGHKDRAARLPSGAISLAFSERAPFQAFRLKGLPVYATQFHPELTWTDNQDRFRRYMVQYGFLFGAEAAQAQLDAHRPSPEANGLLQRFAQAVSGGEL